MGWFRATMEWFSKQGRGGVLGSRRYDASKGCHFRCVLRNFLDVFISMNLFTFTIQISGISQYQRTDKSYKHPTPAHKAN